MIEISRIVSNDILTPIELAPHIIAVVVCQKASEVVGMLRNVDTRLPLFLKRVKKVEVN